MTEKKLQLPSQNQLINDARNYGEAMGAAMHRTLEEEHSPKPTDLLLDRISPKLFALMVEEGYDTCNVVVRMNGQEDIQIVLEAFGKNKVQGSC